MRWTQTLLALAATTLSLAAQSAPPNILLILADDVTYSDLPLYGGRNISTPNIDRLASQGLRHPDIVG